MQRGLSAPGFCEQTLALDWLRMFVSCNVMKYNCNNRLLLLCKDLVLLSKNDHVFCMSLTMHIYT